MLFIIANLDSVSLAMTCLFCSGECQFSLCVIAVGLRLLWRRHSLYRVKHIMYMTCGLPLQYFRCVGVLFGGVVPDDRSVFKC